MRVKKNIAFFLWMIVVFPLLVSCVSNRKFPHATKRMIHRYEMVSIGEVDQAILISGKKANNPVLLYLHGGPGFPMLPFEPFDPYMQKLENLFTIVYWEQRGTGISFNTTINKESMNVEQFVQDTREVVEYLRETLNVEKVYIWGHSWGSNLGAIYAARYPETLHAYVATGQSANPFLNERLAYEYVLDRATRSNNRRALRQLAKIDTLPDNYRVKDALTIRKWIYRYGGVVHSSKFERPYVDLNEIKIILTTPIYPLIAKINIIRDPYYSINTLWKDLRDLNLFTEAPRIDVPVYFLIGRYDIIVSHVLAEKYFNHLVAPKGKYLVWFEYSAHRPQFEELEKFISVMTEIQGIEAETAGTTPSSVSN